MSTKINVYISPDESIRERYENLVCQLLSADFSPFVYDKEADFSISFLCGFVFNFDEKDFIDLENWSGERVDALISFNPWIDKDDLEVAKTYFAPIFGLNNYQRKIITRSTSRLFRKGYLKF